MEKRAAVRSRESGPVTTPSSQAQAPLAQALADFADRDVLRLTVPGHQAQPDRRPGLAGLLGEQVFSLDIEPMVEGIDLVTGEAPTARQRAQALAAEAWGARRTWFLTNGASQGNHTMTLALRALGERIVVQRSMHSSVMDGMAMAGLEPIVVMPSIDRAHGMAHGVVPADLAETLRLNPDAVAAYVVTPSYFGAVSDVAALAEVAHRHGVPLIVDEAWGPHFGFHSNLPVNALRLGADAVVSSTHKLAGSLGQSAMLHLGHGPWADALEGAIERALRVTSSTSESALLLASLDLARRDLMMHGQEWIGATIEQANEVRARIRAGGRFGLADEAILADPSVVALDPLRIVIDTRQAGLSGHAARRHLLQDHNVHVEMSTDSLIVCIVGAGVDLDVDRLMAGLAALPAESQHAHAPLPPLPGAGPRTTSLRQAMLGDIELVPAQEAIGRVSADSLAAYPPGVPNLLPGELVTAEVVDFLQAVAAAPTGYVRGAADPLVSRLRVLRT